MTRDRLRPLLPVLLIALLLPGCAGESHSSAGANDAIVQPNLDPFNRSAAWSDTDRRAATSYIRAQHEHMTGHWQALVLLDYAVTGPADHLRWTGIVVGGDGQAFSIESEQGDSGALATLLAPGDYFAAHLRYGLLAVDDTKLFVRGAVRSGTEGMPERP